MHAATVTSHPSLFGEPSSLKLVELAVTVERPQCSIHRLAQLHITLSKGDAELLVGGYLHRDFQVRTALGQPRDDWKQLDDQSDVTCFQVAQGRLDSIVGVIPNACDHPLRHPTPGHKVRRIPNLNAGSKPTEIGFGRCVWCALT